MKRPPPLTPARLRRLSLPPLAADADKEARGRVLVVGGSEENPGALLLAGEAALRVGAGKLQMAAPGTIALAAAAAVPESRVFALAAAGSGGIGPRAAGAVAERAEAADALLIGPGMVDEDAAGRLAAAVLARIAHPAVVLDSGGLAALRRDPRALAALEGRAVLTPHAGEMAQLLERSREEVEADPEAAAREAAHRFGAVVALKGPATTLAAPDGTLLRYARGGVGLATSGSGDVLAGMVAGLLARRATPLAAAAWAVYLHGEAGNALARRQGRVGFLARELAAELPRLLERTAAKT